jgi:hypothetical protein
VPESEVNQQQQAFQSLIDRLGQASPDEIESILASREQVEPEPGLSAETIERIQARIRQQR